MPIAGAGDYNSVALDLFCRERCLQTDGNFSEERQSAVGFEFDAVFADADGVGWQVE